MNIQDNYKPPDSFSFSMPSNRYRGLDREILKSDNSFQLKNNYQQIKQKILKKQYKLDSFRD